MKPLLALALALALFAILAACSRSEPPEIVAVAAETESLAAEIDVTIVDAADAAALLAADDSVVVLDVRTPEEFAEGHIEGAVNVNFKASKFKDEAAALDPSTTYLLHCRSGARSTASLEVLQGLGFKTIYHLDVGMNGWIKAGNPVEK